MSKLCECGCGRVTSRAPQNYHDRGIKKGDHYRFIYGHQPKWSGHRKEQVNEWWSRARARKMKGSGPCEIAHIGGCLGPVEVHHLDGNPHNNENENLMHLCKAHHRLVENGRIDLEAPEMPRFYVSSGKRRYLYEIIEM